MPNHVQNILTIVGHKNHVEPLMALLDDGESKFSFKKIVPMPKELEGTRAPANIVSEAQYKKEQYEKNFKEENPHFSDKGSITKKMSEDWIQRFGADNWYDWTVGHWGTKWGAYDVVVEDPIVLTGRDGYIQIVISFQTAWSSGSQVIDTLGRNHPTIEFYLKYADEDCGSNTGKIWWQDGGIIDNQIPDYSMENYFECWGGEEYWEKVDGEWQYIDD